jgi:hypothetical protein
VLALFLCADAYLDVEINGQDESSDSSIIPKHFPSHARRPKASVMVYSVHTILSYESADF